MPQTWEPRDDLAQQAVDRIQAHLAAKGPQRCIKCGYIVQTGAEWFSSEHEVEPGAEWNLPWGGTLP